MKKNIFVYFLVLCSTFNIIHTGPIPIKLGVNKENEGNLEFALQLPNNDTVQIDLSFKLLTYSNSLNKSTTDETTVIFNDEPITSPTTTTTTTENPEPKYVTVQEAIEAFRQELIKKERDIAGVIESEHPFYRHFKLQFQDDLSIAIRCTYDSNYKRRILNISCYEYHEYESERILSNGEVEIIRMQDLEYKSDVELIDARNVKQVYTMEIS